MTWRKVFPFLAILLTVTAFVATRAHQASNPVPAGDLRQQVSVPFRFAAFGDTRFTHSTSDQVANTEIRQAIIRAIAKEKPSFVSIGGDIVYRGDDSADWDVWDAETRAWRDENLMVYPALGNHDLHGNQTTALANYFKRFPELNGSRYYSARIANCLMLVLDSSLSETTGAQGEWFKRQIDSLPSDVAFVLVVLHHPPYTSSSDAENGGGHSARSMERDLASLLEDRQAHTRARFVVFSGHVHNYERHQHGGVTYFVTGGGGARPYPIERKPSDLFQGTGVNYHYLLAEVSAEKMNVTMNRVEIKDGKEIWTRPDTVTIIVPPK
jgi:Icc-related predicted phosphoesterase